MISAARSPLLSSVSACDELREIARSMLLHHTRPVPHCEGRVEWLPAQRTLPSVDSSPPQGSPHCKRRRPDTQRRAQQVQAACVGIRRDAGWPSRAAPADAAESATAEEIAITTVDDVLDGVEAYRRTSEFSFRLAVALAGCAFESYSSPAINGREISPAVAAADRDPGGGSADAADRDAAPSVLREVGVNGTETTYVSA